MLKNSLFQPSLSFCFSALFFLSSFLVNAPSLFCSALFLSFLFQHFFSFSFFCFSATFFCLLFSPPFLVKRLLSASFSASFLLSSCNPTFFSFLFDVLPYFFQPKNFFQPKTFFSPLLFICGSAPPSFLLFNPSFFS